MKYACIDIGTNTVLLAIVEKADQPVDVLDISTITRLGEGLKKSGVLSAAAMERTFTALERYGAIIKENNVEKLFCVGTASLREAENSKIFLDKAREKLGIRINIISEKEEAFYTYLSVKSDAFIGKGSVIITDIGGGSTEIIKGDAEGFADFVSLPVGSVKLTEMFIKNDPPAAKEILSLSDHVRGLLNIPFHGDNSTFVGTGGTITNVASIISCLDVFQKKKIHGHKITLKEIESLVEKLKNIASYDRAQIKGMEKGREDIMLQGILLLKEIMEYFGARKITVNANGVRYGVLSEAFHKNR